jgi:type II secretory pathway predicted ATPase ExeA
MRSAVYLLVGFPGAGKYTVARALEQELARRGIDVMVIDNHYVNNPVFGVLQLDGETPLPAGVWPLIAQVRDAILTAVEEYAPRERSFIFTNYITAEEAFAEPQVGEYIARLTRLAVRRGTRLRIVRLTCAVEELARRVESPDRRERLKTTSAVCLREAFASFSLWQPNAEDVLTIDNTDVSPSRTAQLIAQHAWSSVGHTSAE